MNAGLKAGGSGLARKARRMKHRLGARLWAVFLAWKDPATPRIARIAIAAAVAYALSPIDLIPDFIPILGQLDDLVIVPALIAIALRLIPADVAVRCRKEAWRHMKAGDRIRSSVGWAAALTIGIIWAGLAFWLVSLFLPGS
jgi:uncharacterized membrane protein YkvA (DUF1232 family)